ncbi:hypothetical protein CC80DRAFT_398892 [Byssothecium circinans]|uniref:Thioesterase domain-containing protein n=1 Tax=Byssothecium circinans TaxID=147558 RepID=A0A6A5UDJ3_9PLEO|nr:hypothetical protein CC80DRAFT_398892 [Byssothecium circinans]
MNRLRPIPIPSLSSLYRHAIQRNTRRLAQTPAQPTATPAPAPSKPRRFRAARIWYGLVFAGGLGLGFIVKDFVGASPWPAPGTQEDELYLKACTKEIEDLDIVKYMRSQSRPRQTDPTTDSGSPPATPTSQQSSEAEAEQKAWIELDIKNNITESKDDWGYRTRTATFQSMAGTRGLGVQRAFMNAETGELVAVVWIGKSLSGWPGLAHGGAIATIFQDCMARMVAGPAAKWSWLPSWKDMTKKAQPGEAKETVEIVGTLEDVNGDLLVRAKGTYPVAG